MAVIILAVVSAIITVQIISDAIFRDRSGWSCSFFRR